MVGSIVCKRETSRIYILLPTSYCTTESQQRNVNPNIVQPSDRFLILTMIRCCWPIQYRNACAAISIRCDH